MAAAMGDDLPDPLLFCKNKPQEISWLDSRK
jgi:hypothetical protein